MHKLLTITSSNIIIICQQHPVDIVICGRWPRGLRIIEWCVCNFLQLTILILYGVYCVYVYIRFGICTLCPYVSRIHTLKVQQRVFFTEEFQQKPDAHNVNLLYHNAEVLKLWVASQKCIVVIFLVGESSFEIIIYFFII